MSGQGIPDARSQSLSGLPELGSPAVLRHVVDVHCHPTDSEISQLSMDRLPITICAMATRQADQGLVRDLAAAHPDKVIPCFGYHPWFTHWISLAYVSSKRQHYEELFPNWRENVDAFERLLPLLPSPIPLEDIILDLRQNLEAFPKAMLGEVGLDRVSRVPFDYFSSPRELTPFYVPFEHQLAVLEAQIELAIELGRNISVHSVKAQKATVDLLGRLHLKHGDRWRRLSLDLHSCAFSPQMWMDVERRHPNAFLSLSTAINSRSENHRALIAACSPHRILIESDFHCVDECTERTWAMLLTVAEIKGWEVETTWRDDLEEHQWGAVRRLEHNWRVFEKGNHIIPGTQKKGRRRAQQTEMSVNPLVK
ncbi:Metallo-dependent hydrolase [Leucogyrophana mollusca]|uniref:Metallo-dependent hydrolase n=1 Tax=Leucogyrophana mollusca TaxID=85980 RepID=A0ACB8BDC0_9AGAM|nr:Metallo-dependent hydrolase [Leucogyrophana mollusca]